MGDIPCPKSVKKFEDAIKGFTSGTWVVEFGADWSEGSKLMHEVAVELSKEADPSALRFLCLEAEAVPDISLRYGIKAVPTFIFLQNGAETSRVDGVAAAVLTTKVRQALRSGPLPPLPPLGPAASAPESSNGVGLEQRLKSLVRRSKIMVFMKGSPQEPRCGFSRQLMSILSSAGVSEFGHFDILSDEAVREGLKKFSNWPTYPQLYVDGEQVGGLDIVKEMAEMGELADALKDLEFNDKIVQAAATDEYNSKVNINQTPIITDSESEPPSLMPEPIIVESPASPPMSYKIGTHIRFQEFHLNTSEEIEENRLKCQRCNSMISYQSTNRVSKATRHASSCLGIRPFACTDCQYLFSDKTNAKRHISKKCTSASIVVVDKERNDLEVKSGLNECFPGQGFAWSGFSA